MTFTPPKKDEYPATYRQGNCTVTIHGWFDDRYYLGLCRHDQTGMEFGGMWGENGFSWGGSDQLEDIPKRVMTDLRDKIAQAISDNYQYGGKSIAETADAILALPEIAERDALRDELSLRTNLHGEAAHALTKAEAERDRWERLCSEAWTKQDAAFADELRAESERDALQAKLDKEIRGQPSDSPSR